jgi:hypothetical protein
MAIITEEKLIKTLQNYNPWWKNPESIRADAKPQKRVAYYEAMNVIGSESLRRFAVLSGARRVGKTTIMYQMIEKLLDDGVNPRNILYVTFDNPILKMVTPDDVFSTYETLYPIEGERYLFFDEIQYTDSWELWMKVFYDLHKNIRMTATGSASPILEKGSSDSGVGRWSVLKVPTLSFYEYCELLELPDRPKVPDNLKFTDLVKMSTGELADLMNQFSGLMQHFNRYLVIGGFPELVLYDNDINAQRILREDVVDKVIKRDVLTLFKVRNPLSMEKLFLYLCMTSSEIFNKQTASKELEVSVSSIEDYISFLEKSNLIYISAPTMVGKKAALKGKPKIYIADAAIRNAVLMLDDVLSDDTDMGVMVETAVYKHVLSYYRGTNALNIGYYRKASDNQKEVDIVINLPREKILCEVKYRNNASVSGSDAVVSLSNEEGAGVSGSFVITKSLTDYGLTKHNTLVPVFRIPALVFTYLLGKGEADRGSRG